MNGDRRALLHTFIYFWFERCDILYCWMEMCGQREKMCALRCVFLLEYNSFLLEKFVKYPLHSMCIEMYGVLITWLSDEHVILSVAPKFSILYHIKLDLCTCFISYFNTTSKLFLPRKSELMWTCVPSHTGDMQPNSSIITAISIALWHWFLSRLSYFNPFNANHISIQTIPERAFESYKLVKNKDIKYKVVAWSRFAWPLTPLMHTFIRWFEMSLSWFGCGLSTFNSICLFI